MHLLMKKANEYICMLIREQSFNFNGRGCFSPRQIYFYTKQKLDISRYGKSPIVFQTWLPQIFSLKTWGQIIITFYIFEVNYFYLS